MSLPEELLSASYKGVSFSVRSSTTEGGRKSALKEFPNSNLQLIEDLGLKPRSFELDIILSDDNYISAKERMLLALEDGKPGILVHPFFGRIYNVVATDWTAVEEIGALNSGRLIVSFKISDTVGTPAKSRNSLSLIDNAVSIARNSIKNDIANRVKVSNIFADNYEKLATKLNSFIKAVEKASSFVASAKNQIDGFSGLVTNFQAGVYELISLPNSLADSFNGLMTSLANLHESPEDTTKVMRQLYGFGSDDVEIQENTVSRVEAKTNNSVINAATNADVLCSSYSSAVRQTFSTVDELDEIADILEAQFKSVSSAEGDPLSSETINAIADVRLSVQQYIEEVRPTVRRLTKIETNTIPARVLAYQYYGSDELGQDIAQINNNANVSFLDGELEIVTA